MSGGDEQEPYIEIRGSRLKALFVHLKEREEELDRETFATLNSIERALFQYMSIDDVERLVEEHSPQRGER